MNILDHISLGVDCADIAARFYTPLLSELDIDCLAKNERFAAYGRDKVQFIAITPENGLESSAGNGTHICFVASKREQVDAFHKAALSLGGQCAGAPGAREQYPIPGVYTTFILDPFGHKLEAIYKGFDQ